MAYNSLAIPMLISFLSGILAGFALFNLMKG